MQLRVEADELGNELEQLAKAKVSTRSSVVAETPRDASRH